MMKLLITILMLSVSIPALADDDTGIDKRVTLRTIEPERDVGYSVGDKLSRTVILEVDKPYELLPTSLPVPGNQKKRRNQELGIELRDVSVDSSSTLGKNVYRIRLTYQVFTNRQVAKPGALPAEFIKFGGKGENFQVRVPNWNFRISPLAVFGAVNVEKDMSSFHPPLLLDASRHRVFLQGLLAAAGLCLLGLFYVLGTATWLPRMGRPFARALRDIKRLPAGDQGLAQAVQRMHQAFNDTAGASVFDSTGFIRQKPGFAPVQEEIDRFFGLSRSVFFEPGAAHGIDDPLSWLKLLCRRCRDCERGLK